MLGTTMSYHLPGTVLSVNGKEFIVTHIISAVNYGATRIEDGGRFKLNRSAPYPVVRTDNELLRTILSERAEAKGVPFEMGQVVLIESGKVAGKYGIVATVAAKTYVVAVPGSSSMRFSIGHPALKAVEGSLMPLSLV